MKIKFSLKSAVFTVLMLAWSVVIFLFSAQNGDDSSGVSGKMLAIICEMMNYNPPPDVRSVLTLLLRKGAHMTEFGVLALLWLGVFQSGSGREGWTYRAAFGASSFYAATDEIHQLFVSDRAGRFTDWLIDSSGAIVFLLAGWLIICLIGKIKSHRKGS